MHGRRRSRSPTSRRARAGSSSTRCSAPGWRGRSTASTPRRSPGSTRQARAVVAVDLPSGVSGPERRRCSGAAFKAEHHRHLLPQEAGASALSRPARIAARLIVADIGIRDDVLASIRPHAASRTIRRIWSRLFPSPAADTHKYARGHVGVFSGGPAATGAARLSAMAAARAGAGAVTLLSPANALAVNAAHLTSIILRKADSMDDVAEFLAARKPGALVFGPGLGTHDEGRRLCARPDRRGGWTGAARSCSTPMRLTVLRRQPRRILRAGAVGRRAGAGADAA